MTKHTKIALVVGHNREAQGAIRRHDLTTEYAYFSEVADKTEVILSSSPILTTKVFKRNPRFKTKREEIVDVYKRVTNWDADASVELHFNAHDKRYIQGVETISSGTRISVKLADILNHKMVEFMGKKIRNRGVKVVQRGERGHWNVNAGKPPAVLWEPFFGSYLADREDEYWGVLDTAVAPALQSGLLTFAEWRQQETKQ